MPKQCKQSIRRGAALLVLASLAACNARIDEGPVQRGQFIDSPVQGLDYFSGSDLKGQTGALGEFEYRDGDRVRFSLGTIALGQGNAAPFVTPRGLDTLSAHAAVNVARFLMTLDEDSNAANGIRLSQAVRDAANVNTAKAIGPADFESADFASTAAANFAISANGDSRELVTAAQASSHLDHTEADLADGSFDNDPIADADGDGIADERDNCPDLANPEQVDSNANGTGDACEAPDGDADGHADELDNCPSTANPEQSDSDGDGLGDACDVLDDRDDDADSVANHADNCPQIANEDQADDDADGIGNACDLQDNGDDDSDGVQNHADNCPTAFNADQSDSDGDGIGDACDPQDDGDTDADGVANHADNCPFIPNPDQADADGDTLGDACDAVDDRDADGDGVFEAVDNCPGLANPDQADLDADGLGDACDPSDDRPGKQISGADGSNADALFRHFHQYTRPAATPPE